MSESVKGPVQELDQSASAAAYRPSPKAVAGKGRTPGRFWSARRIPAALLALVLVGGAGLLLFDIASVRADRPGMQWRRTEVEGAEARTGALRFGEADDRELSGLLVADL